MKYKKLAISSPEKLIFGDAPLLVRTPRGLIIGGGRVYPEINFTLPPMEVAQKTITDVRKHYTEIVEGVLERAIDLHSNGLVLEFETLIEMTMTPSIGAGLVMAMNEICERYYQKHKIPVEIRLTPNDLREFDRPPRSRTSSYLDSMLELFELGAKAGGNLLSIESTGGKEISDSALMMCDMKRFIFSQAVLGVRDMEFLWPKIVGIALKNQVIAGGDTACAFGNTAMVLADRHYIPKIFAAVARVATVVRTIVAIEQGATGPDKDCAYEGPFIKAITGIPISMEGKTAACAHLSPVGNIAAAAADLWSNESVQNIKLLSGMAPVACYEQLEYDVRLMNEAKRSGEKESLLLQKLLVNSDICYDPQALILAPENVIRISKQIVKGNNSIEAAVLGSLEGVNIIREAIDSGQLQTDEKELVWMDMLIADISSVPTDEGKFVEMMLPELGDTFIPSEYGL
jgi:methanol---5-hydroxybenzimidazolylcobamide Co-methyltransferase